MNENPIPYQPTNQLTNQLTNLAPGGSKLNNQLGILPFLWCGTVTTSIILANHTTSMHIHIHIHIDIVGSMGHQMGLRMRMCQLPCVGIQITIPSPHLLLLEMAVFAAMRMVQCCLLLLQGIRAAQLSLSSRQLCLSWCRRWCGRLCGQRRRPHSNDLVIIQVIIQHFLPDDRKEAFLAAPLQLRPLHGVEHVQALQGPLDILGTHLTLDHMQVDALAEARIAQLLLRAGVVPPVPILLVLRHAVPTLQAPQQGAARRFIVA